MKNWSFKTSLYLYRCNDFCRSRWSKAIVIGEKGTKLKTIGMDARKDMEKCLSKNYAYTLGKSEGWLV